MIKTIFTPHRFQKEIDDSWETHRFGVIVAHRRFGKSFYVLNKLIMKALQAEPDTLWFGIIVCPTLKQAKAIHWRPLEKLCRQIDGVKLHRSELTATFKNGAQIKLLGAETFDSIRGVGTDLVILDEAQHINPQSWTSVILPTLADRKGKAIIIGTPQGHNFLYKCWNHAETDDNWFRKIYTIEDTNILDKEVVEDQRKQMSEDEFNAEFMCSFESDLIGSYYAKLMGGLEEDGCIGDYPYNPHLLVHVAMDLGMADMQAIWFYQRSHNAIHLIDFYQDCDEPHQFYLKFLKEKPYIYGNVYLPFDSMQQSNEREDKKSRFRITKDFGFNAVRVKKLGLDEGINKVRMLLPRCRFDQKKCEVGIEALKQYRKQINDKMSIIDKWGKKNIVYKPEPLHDWCSHASDAFRYLAVSFKEKDAGIRPPTMRAKTWRAFS